MRKVLASLKPYYYYLVGEGIKKIEVRKNTPRASDWNKEVLFYMSKDVKSFAKIPKEFQEKYRKHFGKVGMQFVCDKIYTYYADDFVGAEDFDGTIITEPKEGEFAYWMPNQEDTCLRYLDIKAYGKGKTLYGWHISDLKIYDKPKPIMQFYKPCPIEWKNCPGCELYSTYTGCCMNNIDRPPKSWCFVESLGE